MALGVVSLVFWMVSQRGWGGVSFCRLGEWSRIGLLWKSRYQTLRRHPVPAYNISASSMDGGSRSCTCALCVRI